MKKNRNNKRSDNHRHKVHYEGDEHVHNHHQQQQQQQQLHHQLIEQESEYTTLGDGSSVGGGSSVGMMTSNRSSKEKGSLMDYRTPERSPPLRKRENDSFASPDIPLMGSATGQQHQQQQQQEKYYGPTTMPTNSSRRRFANALSSSGNILRGSSSSLKSSMYSSPFYGNPSSSNQFLQQHHKYNQNQQYRWIAWLMKSILASPMIVLVLWLVTWLMHPFHYQTNQIQQQQQQLIQPPSPRSAVRIPVRPKEQDLNPKLKQKQKKIKEIQQRQQQQKQQQNHKQDPNPPQPVTTNKILPVYVPLGTTVDTGGALMLQQQNNLVEPPHPKVDNRHLHPNHFRMAAGNQVITDAQGQPVMTMTTNEEGQPIFMTTDEQAQPAMMVMSNNIAQPVIMTTAEGQPLMMTNEQGQPIVMMQQQSNYQEEGEPVMEYSNMMMQAQPGSVHNQQQEHDAHVIARHRPPVLATNSNQRNNKNKQNSHAHNIQDLIPTIHHQHNSDKNKNNHHNLFPHPHPMGRTQNRDQLQQEQPLQRIYYYDPLESPDGRQLPSHVYDTQGRPISLSYLMDSSDADIYLEPPPVRGSQSPPAMTMTQNQNYNPSNGNSEPLPYPQEQLNMNDIKNHLQDTTANLVPSIPTFWGESTFQDQSIIVATVAVMALLVGALSARRLRSRSFLSSCIENESLEEEIAYDTAFTSDNYHTFSYKGDLEKFDV